MSLLSKLRKHRNDLPEQPKEAAQDTNEPEQGNDTAAKEEAVRERIKAFLYDDPELIEQMLPVFMRLEEVEGSDAIFELIEAKETQLSNVLDNEDAFKQDTNPDEKNIPEDNNGDADDDDNTDYVMRILTEKYGE